jgi:hypothetical protein
VPPAAAPRCYRAAPRRAAHDGADRAERSDARHVALQDSGGIGDILRRTRNRLGEIAQVVANRLQARVENLRER